MTIKAWNVSAAVTEDELMDILFFAASGIKTQLLKSPIVNQPKHQKLKSRLSEIADELHGMQQDVKMPNGLLEELLKE